MATEDDIYQLSIRTQDDYLNGGHVGYFVPDMVRMANTANYAALMAGEAEDHAASAASSYALQVALGTSAYGVGTDPMDLPRLQQFGGSAFRDWEADTSIQPNTQNATYTITALDHGKLLLCTSGTRTWTLPIAPGNTGSAIWIGWTCLIRNRGAGSITLNPGSASDAINAVAAGSGVTIAVSTATLGAFARVVCTGANSFEVG